MQLGIFGMKAINSESECLVILWPREIIVHSTVSCRNSQNIISTANALRNQCSLTNNSGWP